MLSDDLRDNPGACREFLRAEYPVDFLPCLPDFLSFREAAGVLGVAPDTFAKIARVYRLRTDKGRVKKSDLLEFVRGNFLAFLPLDGPENSPK